MLAHVHPWLNFITTKGGRAAVAEANLLGPENTAIKLGRAYWDGDFIVLSLPFKRTDKSTLKVVKAKNINVN